MLRTPFIARALAPARNALKVTWSDGATSSFSSAWLRAQVRDPKFFHPTAFMYIYDHMSFVASPAPVTGAEQVEDDGEAGVRVSWPDHSSIFNTSWLRAQDAALNRSCFPKLFQEKRWNGKDELPEYHFDERKEKMKDWMTDLRVWGGVLFRGVPTNEQGTRDIVELIGPVRQRYHPNFFFEIMTDKLAAMDVGSYSRPYLPAHTDAVEYEDASRIGCLHSLVYSVPKGSKEVDNFLVDGFQALEQLQREDPEILNDLASKHWGHARRRFEPENDPPYAEMKIHKYTYERDCLVPRPILSVDKGKFTQLSFRYPKHTDSSHCSEDNIAIERRYRSYSKLQGIVDNAANQRRFVLSPGTAVLYDNHRMVHGRTELVPGCVRKVNGCFVSNESFIGRWRLMLGEKTGLPDKWLYACPTDALEVLSQRWNK